MPKEKEKRPVVRWPHRCLNKAAAETFDASDRVAMSADHLAERAGHARSSATTLRTHRALEETHAIQRARFHFIPLGFTRSPF